MFSTKGSVRKDWEDALDEDRDLGPAMGSNPATDSRPAMGPSPTTRPGPTGQDTDGPGEEDRDAD